MCDSVREDQNTVRNSGWIGRVVCKVDVLDPCLMNGFVPVEGGASCNLPGGGLDRVPIQRLERAHWVAAGQESGSGELRRKR